MHNLLEVINKNDYSQFLKLCLFWAGQLSEWWWKDVVSVAWGLARERRTWLHYVKTKGVFCVSYSYPLPIWCLFMLCCLQYSDGVEGERSLMGVGLYLQLTRRASGLFPKVWGGRSSPRCRPGVQAAFTHCWARVRHGRSDSLGLAHHNNNKDIPEQDKRERTGCFSVNQSVPPLGCAVPCQEAAPSHQCQEWPRNTNELGAVINTVTCVRNETYRSSVLPFAFSCPHASLQRLCTDEPTITMLSEPC